MEGESLENYGPVPGNRRHPGGCAGAFPRRVNGTHFSCAARTIWGKLMSYHAPVPGQSRALLRIAIPSLRHRHQHAVSPEPARPSRDEFQRLLDGALERAQVIQFHLTKTERRQLAAQRRLRNALYDDPAFA